jgi:hypothetical protein
VISFALIVSSPPRPRIDVFGVPAGIVPSSLFPLDVRAAGYRFGFGYEPLACCDGQRALRRQVQRVDTRLLHHVVPNLSEVVVGIGLGATGAKIADFFEKEWRTRHDSNVWPSPSEGDALSS